jgi:hypothetical protein
MLGLDSMTSAKTYPAWFSGRAGYPAGGSQNLPITSMKDRIS